MTIATGQKQYMCDLFDNGVGTANAAASSALHINCFWLWQENEIKSTK